MGTGIGIVASRTAGLNVTLIDPAQNNIMKSKQFVENWCNKEMHKDRMTSDEKQDVLNRINYSQDVKDLKTIDFSIEAANEDFNIKKLIF